MANHKVEVSHWEQHTASHKPSSNATWNIGNVREAIIEIRHIISSYTKKRGRFIVKHNECEVYNSEHPVPINIPEEK